MEKGNVRIIVRVEGGERHLEISREMMENEAMEYFEKISSELKVQENRNSSESSISDKSSMRKIERRLAASRYIKPDTDNPKRLPTTSYHINHHENEFKILAELEKRRKFEE